MNRKITKTVWCPKCGLEFKCQVVPGEKTTMHCPRCNTKGVFECPLLEQTIVEKTEITSNKKVIGCIVGVCIIVAVIILFLL